MFLGITHVLFKLLFTLTKESYHNALSREMTQAVCVKHGTGVWYLRSIDG